MAGVGQEVIKSVLNREFGSQTALAGGDLFRQKVQGGQHGEQLFCGWTHGASPYRTLNGDTPGLVAIACAVPYPAYNLPTVT